MNPGDAFERILRGLHRATLDDRHWPATAALIDEVCGTEGNVLAVGQGSGADARVLFHRYLYRGEPRPELAREYFDVYYPQDEAMPRIRKLPPGTVAHTPALYSDRERKTSKAYNEAWNHCVCQNGLAIALGEPDGLRVVWGFTDPVVTGDWQSERLQLIERLVPHVRQFVRVRQRLAAAEAIGTGLTGLLDNDRIGVAQLDRAGRVVAANAPALEILRRGDGLRDRDGVLDAWLPADRTRLRRLIGRALPSWRGEEPPGGGSMTLQRASGRSRLAVHVNPVGEAARDFGSRRVAALVLVVDPARRPRIDASRVAKTLGLSASEARLAAHLAEGRKVREIAALSGWRENYVRWLVRQVYGKLGASGQVDVARQVLAVEALPPR